MGILDDAIREHLDLKRKHGAAEDELQRQEEEALGPARREVAPAQAQDTNGAGEAAAAEASPSEAEEPAGEAQAEEPSAEAAAEAHTDPAIEVAPTARRRGPQPEPEPEPEPLPPEPAAGARRDRAGGRAGAPSRRGSLRLGGPRGDPGTGRRHPATRIRGPGRRGRRAVRGRAPVRGRGGRRRRKGRRRSAGHAGLPPGDSGARPALVRAEASTRLRFRLAPRGTRVADTGRRRMSCGGDRPPRRPPLDATQRRPVPLDSTEPSMPS